MAQSINVYLGSGKSGEQRLKFVQKEADNNGISISAFIQQLIDDYEESANKPRKNKDMENKEVRQ